MSPQIEKTYREFFEYLQKTWKSPHIERACEVAWAGNYSVTFIGKIPPNKQAEFWQICPLAVCFIPTCPCGNSGHPILDCTCTIGKIHRYRKTKQWKLSMDADMVVDWPPILPFRGYQPESFDKILERVEYAKDHVMDELFMRLNTREFLNKNLHQNVITKEQLPTIENIASTIALLDKSREIKVMHLSEAIQYKNNRERGSYPM